MGKNLKINQDHIKIVKFFKLKNLLKKSENDSEKYLDTKISKNFLSWKLSKKNLKINRIF